DFLDQMLVRDYASRPVVALSSESTLEAVRERIATATPEMSHQGFPVVDAEAKLVGVVTRRDLLDGAKAGQMRIVEIIKRPLAIVFDDNSLREAADLMVGENIGRLPVVARDAPRRLVGMLTRSDLLMAHQRRLHEADRREVGRLSKRRTKSGGRKK